MNNEKGMTFVELMITVVIISLTLVILLDILDWGVSLTSDLEKETRALFLAQQRIEEAKSLINKGKRNGILDEGIIKEFHYRYSIPYQPDENGVWDIKVTISYDDDKTLVLFTKIGDRNGS